MTQALLCLALLAAQPSTTPALPKPKTVTLNAEQTKLSIVLADLAKKTGVTIEDKRGEADDPVTLTLKDATYWEAIDAVADAAHARVSVNPRDGLISLVKRKDKDPVPVSRDGLFRAAVKRVSAVHDFDTGDSVYTAAVEIAWEPGLLPLYLETSPRNFKVLDEKGKPQPVRQEGSSLAPVDGRTAFLLDLPLPAFDRNAKKIGQLEGKLTVIAPSRMLQLTFDPLDQLDKDVKAGKKPAAGEAGMTCTVKKVVLADDRWSVQVALEYPPGGPTFESYQSWVVNNEMTLSNQDGTKRLASNSYVLDGSSSRHAVLTYHFTGKDRGKPQDWKLLYRTPASIVEIPLGFTFKDVRLP
jgi:hypothetical protein